MYAANSKLDLQSDLVKNPQTHNVLKADFLITCLGLLHGLHNSPIATSGRGEGEGTSDIFTTVGWGFQFLLYDYNPII